MNRNIIIIGAGHNGLVTAYYLAKAGFKPLVLERREIVGGACVTEEFHPGFRCSTLATSTGPLLPQIVRDLQLERRGVEFIKPAVRVLALNANGPSICVYEVANRTADELARVSGKDAQSYPDFVKTFARIGCALAPLLTMTPPNIDQPAKGELWNLGKLGWGIRGLGRKDEYRLLRYGPMAVADLAAEWFETELLKAATEAGAEIRTNAKVVSISVKDGKAAGVVLTSGEEIPAWTTVSNADPGVTLLELLAYGELEPSFLGKIRNYRAHGTVAKVHLALSALPNFTGLNEGDDCEKLSGRIHIGPDIDYLEHAFDAAKYGDFSAQLRA